MTAHEILQEAIRLRKEDPTDTTTLTENNAVALIGMNKANRDICARILHPRLRQSVTLDADKRFDLSALSNAVQQIIEISKHEDYTSSANWGKAETYDWEMADNDTVVVPAADASGTVYVHYEAIPADLVNPTPTTGIGATSPTLIPVQYHRALALMALSMMFASENRKDNAMFWEAEYQSFLESIRPVKNQTVIDPCYTV